MTRYQRLQAAADRLTMTQRQCLRLTYQHKTSKEIAPILGLSPHSVDAHIRIAMKVLGVDSRREAALILKDIEAAQAARRKLTIFQYEAAGPPSHAHASEGQGPGWNYPSNRSNLEAVKEHSTNISAMETPVEQSGFKGAVSDPALEERTIRPGVSRSLVNLDARKKLIIILLTALLSAMAFTTIVSGFAAMSLLVTGEDGAN